MGTRILRGRTCFACSAEGLGFCATLVFLKLIIRNGVLQFQKFEVLKNFDMGGKGQIR